MDREMFMCEIKTKIDQDWNNQSKFLMAYASVNIYAENTWLNALDWNIEWKYRVFQKKWNS